MIVCAMSVIWCKFILTVRNYNNMSINGKSLSCRKSLINWDSNVVDRLLHVASPLLLIAAAIILLAFAANLEEPKREMSCMFPREFTLSFAAYGLSACSSGLSKYYEMMPDNVPDYNLVSTCQMPFL